MGLSGPPPPGWKQPWLKAVLTRSVNSIINVYYRPNDGFIEQLRMYEAMEWQVDRSSQVFRQYQLERISQMISQGKGTTSFPVLLYKSHPDTRKHTIDIETSISMKHTVAFGELIGYLL